MLVVPGQEGYEEYIRMMEEECESSSDEEEKD
jgi:hypothetical protein